MSVRRISIVIVGGFVALGIIFGTGMLSLQGSLLNPTEIARSLKLRADTDANGVLSTKEIRKSLIAIIRGVILGHQTEDIDGDGAVDRADIRATTQAFRSLLSASCGNGVLDVDEDCDDGNTTAGDGCSAQCSIEPGYTCSGTPSVCSATKCVFVTPTYDIDHVTNVQGQSDCDALAAAWCPDHIDSTVFFRVNDQSPATPTYCRGASRSCNLITSRTDTQASGQFDARLHPAECVSHFFSQNAVNIPDTLSVVEFGSFSPLQAGEPLYIPEAIYTACEDTDAPNILGFPGVIRTETYPKKLYSAHYPDRSYPSIREALSDTCVVKSPTVAAQNVPSCYGPYCYVHQRSCVGEDHFPLYSYAIQTQLDPTVYPNAPHQWVPCFTGCSQGFCQDDADFLAQFHCTDQRATDGSQPFSVRLNYVQNFLLSDTSQAATDCIKYDAVNYGARRTLLDALLARGVSRDFVDQIAAYRLLNELSITSTIRSTDPEAWNVNDAIVFLQESNTLFSNGVLNAYNTSLNN